MLRNMYGVKKIITTVSTKKVPLVEKYLPGMVNQIVDYQKDGDKLSDIVGKGTVDFVYNTQLGSFAPSIPLLNRETGVLVSIASMFSKELLRIKLGPALPFWLGWIADLVHLWYRFLLRGTNISFSGISGNAGERDDLERTAEIIALGKVKPVMRVVNLDDITAVRKACDEVYAVKGGLGALVIKIA
jgi:NADPH:quinone reductase-like Zn-dependent oxidoreductase